MKAILFTLIVAVAGSLVGCQSQAAKEMQISSESAASTPVSARQPVLVELFTSEGCSSCPAADRVLMTLQNDQPVASAEVIALSFHVDYWNYLGWRDPFSSAAFSRRQEGYVRQFKRDSSYTPQMVVDGTAQFVGSNRPNANEAVANSVLQPKGTVKLAIVENELRADIAGLPEHADATVYLAVAENKLATKVSSGENSGSRLEHTSVVRDLLPMGTIKSLDVSGRFQISIPTNSVWKSENVKYVVFVQESSTLKVLTVGKIAR